MEGSKKYELNRVDLRKIGIGLGVAVTGAILTYLTDLIPNVELGTWTPIVVTVWSVVANIARKFLTDYK